MFFDGDNEENRSIGDCDRVIWGDLDLDLDLDLAFSGAAGDGSLVRGGSSNDWTFLDKSESLEDFLEVFLGDLSADFLEDFLGDFEDVLDFDGDDNNGEFRSAMMGCDISAFKSNNTNHI